MSDSTLDRLRTALAGEYDIAEEIGSGGMATVYLATDVKHDRRVAIKVLRPELAAALGPDRFPREIKIVAQLQHPHVLPLHDSGESEGFLYYVMPYVDGESLRSKVDREGQLPVHDAIRILREVVDALAHAHQRGIMHRDIKPDNVMMSGRHAMVMDFGVAKAVKDAGGEKLTTVGVAVGTPVYMSPEQATAEGELDQRSDIYAVGILGFELLTGKPPFHGKTAQAVLSAHVLETPPSVTDIRPSVAPRIADLIAKCLEKNPADRWQTAEELLGQLEALGTPSGGVTPTDTRPVQATPARAPAVSRRAWIGSAAAAVVVAAGFGGWMLTSGGSEGSGRVETIAVLPILDISGSDQVFIDAMHDALIGSIGRLDVVTVVSRSAVMEYANNSNVTEVAQALDVDAVLEGSVFRAGDVMRINVQLTEPRTLRHLWSQSYEQNVTNVLAAQDSVVAQITTDMGAALAEQGEAAGTSQ
jgi:serine/threonine-protein kinase